MKIIYDTDQPDDKRIKFIGDGKKPYYGFHCFQIKLDDGNEEATLGNWGNQKQRNDILERFKARAEGTK
jgi:hypothetical protein